MAVGVSLRRRNKEIKKKKKPLSESMKKKGEKK